MLGFGGNLSENKEKGTKEMKNKESEKKEINFL